MTYTQFQVPEPKGSKADFFLIILLCMFMVQAQNPLPFGFFFLTKGPPFEHTW